MRSVFDVLKRPQQSHITAELTTGSSMDPCILPLQGSMAHHWLLFHLLRWLLVDQGTAEITLNTSSPHSARRDDSDDNFSLPVLSRPCLLPNIASCLKIAAIQSFGDSHI